MNIDFINTSKGFSGGSVGKEYTCNSGNPGLIPGLGRSPGEGTGYPLLDFPGGSASKESACNAGDLGSIPGSERSTGEGNENPLQYSCLENSMDRGAWWATIHGVPKSRTRLSAFCVCVCVCVFLLPLLNLFCILTI